MDQDRREGGDITAEHMVLPEQVPSEIREFFKGSTVFITGATGYLGKLVLEKLLRSCPDVRKIYILIREKKGKEREQRFQEIFDEPIFDGLKRKRVNFERKVTMVRGDCVLPDLGLGEEDKQKLMEEVDCVFHCAATVRFDQFIKTAAYTNVRAVRDLLAMARQMKKLKALIHVSTAYSHCPRKEIDEKFYPPRLTGDQLLTLVETLEDDVLRKITPTLLGDYPNTYVFTKASAEEVLQTKGVGLPIALVRPSIVIATVKEPVAGWIDNIYGSTGILLGAALGVMRTLHGNDNNVLDVVPADYVVNTVIAAAWEVGTTKALNSNRETVGSSRGDDIPIYNYVSCAQNPLKLREYVSLAEKHGVTVPSPHIVWHHCFKIRPNRLWNTICIYLLHFLPAYVIDGVCVLIGKEPKMVDGYKKINKFGEVISYFAMREWNFKNNNTQMLWRKMKPTDRELFDFNLSTLDWDAYSSTYIRGIRLYLLKDPMETIPQGHVKRMKLMVAHYALIAILCIMLFVFVRFFIRILF